MKHINLSQTRKSKNKELNLFAIVDDEDYDYLMQWRWGVRKYGNRYYAERHFIVDKKRKCQSMHQLIIGKSDNLIIDHTTRLL